VDTAGGRAVKGWRREPTEPVQQAAAGPPPTASESFDDLLAIANMDSADFDAMMAGATVDRNLEVGAKITGTIARISGAEVFVEVGAKSEAVLDASEVPQAQLGEPVEVYVLHIGPERIAVSTRLSGLAAEERIVEAAETGEALAGTVTGRNKGGFEINIGSVSAFCPGSHIDRLPSRDPDAWLGQELEFRVLEADDRVVVSRRALQEEHLDEWVTNFWKTATVGQVVEGTVVSVQSWGAFVDIGGVQGLLPRRTFSWTEVQDLTAVLEAGQRITSIVAKLEPEEGKLELTGRNPDEDPWGSTIERFNERDVVNGRVVSCTDFGAFVEIAPGLQGLVHTSRYGAEKPEPGQNIEVRVLAIDVTRQRIELAPPGYDGDATVEAPESGVEVSGVVRKVLGSGIIVELDEGSAVRRGWLPAGEVVLPAGTVLAQRFRAGQRVSARVIRYEPDRGSVVLSQGPDREGEERAWRSHLREQEAAPSSMGTFADLLGKWGKT